MRLFANAFAHEHAFLLFLPHVNIERLHAFGDSFWARLGNANLSDEFTLLIDWLLNTVNVSVCKLATFGSQDSVFSTSEAILRETITMLTDEYGVRPDDLPALNPFWAKIKKEGALAELRAYLATCRTTGAVNARLKRLNGCGIGRGATKCKFVRSKIEPSHVELPRASKQARLGAFFGKLE